MFPAPVSVPKTEMSVWGKSETFFVIGKRISAVKGGGGREILLPDHERLPGKDSFKKLLF